MVQLKDIFNKESIVKRSKDYWDYKDSEAKIRCGKKYEHLFTNSMELLYDWTNPFHLLSSKQQALLIKGELIRTYDSLPNSDKTRIKINFGLSTFSSKWYKLPSKDKDVLLHHVL